MSKDRYIIFYALIEGQKFEYKSSEKWQIDKIILQFRIFWLLLHFKIKVLKKSILLDKRLLDILRQKQKNNI